MSWNRLQYQTETYDEMVLRIRDETPEDFYPVKDLPRRDPRPCQRSVRPAENPAGRSASCPDRPTVNPAPPGESCTRAAQPTVEETP